MNFELLTNVVTDLGGRWETYGVFTAPFNWDWESGEKTEFNVVPEGDRLTEPFEIADGVTIPTGEHHWVRYRALVEFARKRKLSGDAAWWFGTFYDGTLTQIEVRINIRPSATLGLEIAVERNVGTVSGGDFTKDLLQTRLEVNVSSDLSGSALVQYDNESNSVGMNSRLRWTFNPYGDLFIVYNHNIRDYMGGWDLDSNLFSIKAQRAFRF